jgi:hypothetical protein
VVNTERTDPLNRRFYDTFPRAEVDRLAGVVAMMSRSSHHQEDFFGLARTGREGTPAVQAAGSRPACAGARPHPRRPVHAPRSPNGQVQQASAKRRTCHPMCSARR